MKIEYSKEADALYVYFKEEFVAKSREIEDGVVIDFDEKGQLIGIEVLDVSQKKLPYCHCEEQFLRRSNLRPIAFVRGEIVALRS
jgi:uncharacterized protein YuzE